MIRHVMVDLETWGTTPGSDIRSIGAVVFDPVTGTLGDEFYVNVRAPWYLIKRWWWPFGRLKRDPSTIKWWSKQSREAQQRLDDDQMSLYDGLSNFAAWYLNQDRDGDARNLTLWANGPHFDEAILGTCFRTAGWEPIWYYRAPRDCRTIWEAAGGVEVPFDGVEHDALADAKHQARCVIEAYRKLRLSRHATTLAEEMRMRASRATSLMEMLK